MEGSVRWSLKVSRDTDEALRAYLGQVGGRKGDLSRFVQEAVQARLKEAIGTPRKAKQAARRAAPKFAEALEEVRSRARALTQAQVAKLTTEAVAYARKRR